MRYRHRKLRSPAWPLAQARRLTARRPGRDVAQSGTELCVCHDAYLELGAFDPRCDACLHAFERFTYAPLSSLASTPAGILRDPGPALPTYAPPAATEPASKQLSVVI